MGKGIGGFHICHRSHYTSHSNTIDPDNHPNKSKNNHKILPEEGTWEKLTVSVLLFGKNYLINNIVRNIFLGNLRGFKGIEEEKCTHLPSLHAGIFHQALPKGTW
jgi:hypothetical protein